ncbi:hypothetical protein [Granulicoccus phenolivorans]|uniref:hypothetical protein n=1 Tax=Granulicoccus phenolivorans TaxID=266854 RepID=UPI0004032002|nr:hypothetical protein [Granulicoccus phenolivorans]
MRKAHGLRRYFYEYLFHRTVDDARTRTGEVLPISRARRIRARVDELLAGHGTALADPDLGVSRCLRAIDDAFADLLPGHEPRFGEHTPRDPAYGRLLREFAGLTGVGAPEPGPAAAGRLPVSPYDPAWADRATVKRAGTALLHLPDEAITRATGGTVEALADPRHGSLMLWGRTADGTPYEAGRAMTLDDAAGLTVLMDKMSRREYDQVRDWVIDGGRDPRTGRVDRNRFMSPAALARSAALLAELQAQGIPYTVARDRDPGQLKARLSDTGLEIRLIDPRQEDYAGARIYDNGTVVRLSTNLRVPGGMAVPSPTPDQAVRLLRFAQGQPIPRQDRPERTVGTVGTGHPETGRGRRIVEVPDSYHGERETMFVLADYRVPGEPAPRPGTKLLLRRDAKARHLPTFFVDPEVAETYVRDAVESARQNLQAALDVDTLIAAAAAELQRTAGRPEEIEPPEYAADPEVAAIQRSYWDVLTGARRDLLRPGATEELYRARLADLDAPHDSPDDTSDDDPDAAPDLGNLAYAGTPAEQVRAHAADVPYELVGTWEAEPCQVDGQWEDRRFDPARVATHMTSPTGQWSNLDNLAAALRRLRVDPTELRGTSFRTTRFKDRIITLDEETAHPIAADASPFLRRVGATVRAALEANATTPEDILIDDHGVIAWRGRKLRRDGGTTPVTGEIGQVFAPGDHGEIVTAFASGDDALIAPGFEARIVAPQPGEAPAPVEERTRLRGYEQLLHDRIRYQLAADLVSGRSQVGEPASLNGLYAQLSGTRHPVDFLERGYRVDTATGELTAAPDDWTATIVRTEARRVRYGNDIKQGSTIHAEYRAARDRTDPADDNRFDAWQLTGGRNMAVLTGTDAHGIPAPGGFFDPVMTGGATNQGIVRYLTTDARVDPDGRIIPGDPATLTGARAPLMTRPELDTLRYDPFDRQQMTAATIMQAAEVTPPRGTALMTFGGWTADDPIVVSTEFARAHRIRGAGGRLRDLVVGDKLSDLHGNKGVISLIVDRTLDPAAAEAQGLGEEVAWFRANPGLDVVMSPFSLISRRNAGSARELMGSDPVDLVPPPGRAVPPLLGRGALGRMRFVVTHLAVDEKTRVYDDAEVLAGHGRKASSQLAWALQSQDCPAIMREFYGPNAGAEATLREYLLVTGLDLDADGTLRVTGRAEGLDDRPARRLFALPDLVRTHPRSPGQRPGLNSAAMRAAFGRLIGDRGGDLELPFPLTYPTGETLETAGATTWKLPVLSAHLRSGQEFDDGTSVTHDYTRQYQDVFAEACRYRYLAERLDGPGLPAEQREAVRRDMSEATARAQRAFEAITTDVRTRILTGKTNLFKTGLMSSRLPDSATMVWTSDPRLDVDQIALGPAAAGRLGLAEGDHALVWRDPVLRDAGVRYLRVTIDDRLTGAAINPVMDACFDGDFDGDAVAVVRLHTREADREALARLSVPANLLDTGVVREKGAHPLAMQVSLDTRVRLAADPDLAAELASATAEANRLSRLEAAGEATRDDLALDREVVTAELSGLYRQAQRAEFGAALSFAGREEHLASVRTVCVETGAKGSAKKLAAYAHNLGDAHGVTGLTAADQEESMFATAIKAHGTGLGGMFSQRAVAALRDADLTAVLELTYPVTQSILQAKHDAAEARHKYAMLQGPGRELWRGRRLEHPAPHTWRTVLVDGEPVQASREDWQEQFLAFYGAADGFNVSVNPAYVARVADALADPRTGLIRDLETDPGLRGTVLDRMAYGGDFATLVAAADARENLYDGAHSSQFAPAATRRVREDQDALLAGPTPAVRPGAAFTLSPAVLKADVLAEHTGAAHPRGGTRRSGHAVATGPRRPVLTAPGASGPGVGTEAGTDGLEL